MLRNRSSGLPTSGYDASGGGYGGGGSGGYQGGSYGGYAGGNADGYGGYSSGVSNGGLGDDKYASKRRASSSGLSAITSNPALLACVALAFWAVISTGMNWSKSSKLSKIYKKAGNARTVEDVFDFIENERVRAQNARQEVKDHVREHTDNYNAKVNALKNQIKELEQHKHELIQKHESPDAISQKENAQWREEAFMEQMTLLQNRVRRDSKRSVIDRFGPGPHKVAMTYRLYQQDGTLGPEQRFVIQLAPLDLVPHAVHIFLEQVDHGLWHRDTYFYLSGPHVLQFGPQMFDEQDELILDEEHYESHRIAHFIDLELEELIFPDYHDDFPHVRWTLGYTGRPGGPDLYINKMDNRQVHGPGGQDQHALYEQADPCFGIVVEGQEAMEQYLFNIKTWQDDTFQWLIEEPVPIVKAEILTKKLPPRKPALNAEQAFTSHQQQQHPQEAVFQTQPNQDFTQNDPLAQQTHPQHKARLPPKDGRVVP